MTFIDEHDPGRLPRAELPARVLDLFNQSRAKRRERVDHWQRAYRLVHNRSWSPFREAWMPTPQASEIFPIVTALAGWMTDNRPGFTYIANYDPGGMLGPQTQMLARDMHTTVQSLWVNYDWDAEIEKTLFDAMIYGTGFLKTVWMPHLADGHGDVSIVRVDPFCIYPDPAAHSLDDANYIIEARRMSIQELDRRFPGFARKVQGRTAGDEMLEKREDPFSTAGHVPMSNTAAISPVTAPRWGLPGQSRDHIFRDEGVTVFECWLREHSEVDVEGGVVVDDHWRIVMVARGEVLMDERADALYGHASHPYDRLVFQDIGEFWGISLVDHLAPLQIALNRLLAALQSNAELVGNPIFVEDTNSGIPRTKITNRPGTRITKNPGREVRWLDPPSVSNDLTQLVQFYISEMERVSGLSAIVRGMSPTGRNAQGVIDSVQESAFVRVRLALRALERCLRGMGRKAAALIGENYTEPRVIAMAGESGQQTSQALQGKHFYVTDIGTDEIPLRFTVLAQAGGQQPVSREARQEKAARLFAMGAIDRIAVLEAFDYPNRGEIVQRIQQLEAVGAFNAPGARQRTRNS